jgi:hypothetical protein
MLLYGLIEALEFASSLRGRLLFANTRVATRF